jgi:Rha family phage regulatory protein
MESSTLAPQDLTSFVFADGETLKTTSLIIAEKFDKRHSDVLRAIEQVLTQVSDIFRERNFALSQYDQKTPTGGVKKVPMYELTKDGFMMVVMSFTGAAAMAIKETYINAFNFMRDKLLGKTKYGLFDQLEMPDMPKPQIMPCHPTMMNSKMKNHVQHVIDLTAQSYGGTTNKVCMDLARYFHADSWEMIPMSFYPDICAYFNVHPRFKVGVKENWVMVKESSLELSSRIDLTVKLDTLQKTIEQIDWAKERAKNNSVEDAVFNLSSAVANLRTELAA